MNNLLDHIKQVAKNDVRTYFAPFKGAFDAIKKELRRSSGGGDTSGKRERDLAAQQRNGRE